MDIHLGKNLNHVPISSWPDPKLGIHKMQQRLIAAEDAGGHHQENI